MYIVVYIRALNNLQICVVNALHCTYIQYIVNPRGRSPALYVPH